MELVWFSELALNTCRRERSEVLEEPTDLRTNRSGTLSNGSPRSDTAEESQTGNILYFFRIDITKNSHVS